WPRDWSSDVCSSDLARDTPRLWQYERADGAVRARSAARARPARPRHDDRLRAWLHLRRDHARSRMILNIVILALVTLQRLGELRSEERRVGREGGEE